MYQLDLAERKVISKLDFQGRVARIFWFIFIVVGFLSADGGWAGTGPLTRTLSCLHVHVSYKP